MSTSRPLVSIGELMTFREPDIDVRPEATYQFAGVYCFGKGLFTGERRSGLDTSYRKLTTLREGEFVYPKLMAWEGAFAVVTAQHAGMVVSPEFPVFAINTSIILPSYLDYYFKIPSVWSAIAGSSPGTNVRRRRLNPSDLMSRKIPVPPLAEQRLVMSWIEALVRRIEQAQAVTDQISKQSDELLTSAFHRVIQDVPRKPLGEVAPLTRRPAPIDPMAEYPQVSVRSFGRGTFHKPPLKGSEITWEKPHLVCSGDLVVSNIKAWEGAIAVAGPDDNGRYGSHRYLTYRPIPGVATARFLCSYLLTSEGLARVGEASPGSADRNRTTSTKGLAEILVPVPRHDRQVWFEKLFDKVQSARELQEHTREGRKAMLPAILGRAFRSGV